MPTNEGFSFEYKGPNGHFPMHPQTTKEQVIDWELGGAYGPYQVSLPANGWVGLQQTVALNGVTSTDVVECVNILSGTLENMQAQAEAYRLIDPNVGVNSGENLLTFTCTSQVPTVDLTIQVSWII